MLKMTTLAMMIAHVNNNIFFRQVMVEVMMIDVNDEDIL